MGSALRYVGEYLPGKHVPVPVLIGGGSGTCCFTFMAEDTLSQSSSQHTSRFGNARLLAPATAKPNTDQRPGNKVGGFADSNYPEPNRGDSREHISRE
ncbi:hypothetical protein JTE90_015977 [Oedothorax gibbosus]|uniref:Uncharacterized protein n=1 Tax=Oedothorax gibbosus TaxID=931172 RepID=A0AAV6VTQ7_9ARAC|nr:hypothetical protein JTE90_015977 [Oedothorax gibbosus]